MFGSIIKTILRPVAIAADKCLEHDHFAKLDDD